MLFWRCRQLRSHSEKEFEEISQKAKLLQELNVFSLEHASHVVKTSHNEGLQKGKSIPRLLVLDSRFILYSDLNQLF